MNLFQYKRTTPEEAKAFLRKLEWDIVNEEFKNMTIFQLDCYLFRFDPPLSKNDQCELLEYARTLDLSWERAIVKLGIWLHQHKIPFTLEFKYNRDIPFWFNWQRRKQPARLSKALKENMEWVMSCDLAKIPNRKKEQT